MYWKLQKYERIRHTELHFYERMHGRDCISGADGLCLFLYKHYEERLSGKPEGRSLCRAAAGNDSRAGAVSAGRGSR